MGIFMSVNFSNYLQKIFAAKGVNPFAAGSLTSTQDVLNQISAFSADLSQVQDIDFEKLLQETTSIDDTEKTTDQKALEQVVKALMNIDDVKEAADADNDGILAAEEAKAFITKMMGEDGDIENLSMMDIDKVLQNLNIDLAQVAEKTVNDILAVSANDIANDNQIQPQEKVNNELNKYSNSDNSSNSGDSTKSVNSSGGSRSGKRVASPANTQKDVSNMSIADLENELFASKANVDKEYKNYNNEVKSLNSELATNLTTEKTAAEKSQNEITQAKSELSTHKSNLSNYNSNLSSAKSEVSSISSSISSLQSKLNEKDKDGKPKNDNASIQSQISELQSKKDKLENETIPKLEQDIADTEEKINKLENETIPKSEQDLEAHNKKVAEYQNQINTLATSNPQLQAKMDSYNKAVQYQNQVEQTLATRKADQAKSQATNMPAVGEGSKDYRGNDSTDWTNMPLSYELDGQSYHCVGFAGNDFDGDGKIDFKPDSWEEYQRYAVNAGLINKGQYGSMQCHNYSNVTADIVLGTVNGDLGQAFVQETEDANYGDLDMAGKMGREQKYNSRDYQLCKAADRDAESAIIRNELQNGRPCLVSVPSSQGQHWVVAVGMSENDDILIWDSYNSSMEKLGKTSNNDDTSLHRNMATSNGVMVFVEGTHHSYGNYGYLNYWEDCIGKTGEEQRQIYASKCKKR